ncbi:MULTISPECIES: hypothetical protein [unclassified Frondihabitans]|uniref:hypothetical protein n=1 Tax=unclassified Frondihabitans TaxID=2626248 RepID=UPI000FB59F40|nr:MULTISPECIES: hypothetical protein [unclassified Frondihabitans]RPE73745.1 hypothetical protein EDF37_3442 [Frondihabitans sp. PhB153]RPF02118.1 hypothetical protein EDF39_3439 [Frondihabitans sp. PhB161]
MKIIYDTLSDTISVDGLNSQETRILDDKLAVAFSRNEPIMTVAATIMATAQELSSAHE